MTFDVEPGRLTSVLPRGLDPEIRTLDVGRARGFVSAVSFRRSRIRTRASSVAILSVMDVIRFGLGIRALRLRRRLAQRQLAARAGVSRAVIWRIERGQADRVAVHTLGGVAAVLGARIDLRLLWQGEGLDRLLDARHAALVEHVVASLNAGGWEATSEVSFNIRGERGSIDVLGFHRPTDSLLVVEIKSVVPDLQAMLAGLDRKGRLGRDVARERGWHVTSVTRLLVLPNDRTARRRVDAHAATIRSALPARNVEIRQWLRHPVGTMHGVLFVTDAPGASTRPSVSGRRPTIRQIPRLAEERSNRRS